jgi:ArsR family transcriptional regulator
MKIKKITKLLKAVADPTRLQVMVMLNKKPMTVEAIKERTKVEATLLSHHLKVLKDVKVVTAQRIGKNVLYRIVKTCKMGLNFKEIKLVFK